MVGYKITWKTRIYILKMDHILGCDLVSTKQHMFFYRFASDWKSKKLENLKNVKEIF
jgi:bacterioferritin (cytochrome b1)